MESGDGVGGVGGLLDGVSEDGVWAGFEVDGVGGVESVDGGVELDGVAEVAVPVVGGEFAARRQGSGDGGVEGDGGGLGGDGLEGVAECGVDGVDVGRVGGIVDGDAVDVDVVVFECGQECVEGFGGSADDGGVGAVEGGDADVGVVGEEVVEGICGQCDRRHTALAGEVVGDEFAAECGDAGGVLEGEDAGDACGGDFALGVADDGVGGDAEGGPEFGEGDHDGPEGGLEDVDSVEVGGVGGVAEDVGEGPVDVGVEGVFAVVDGFGEGWCGVEECAPMPIHWAPWPG